MLFRALCLTATLALGACAVVRGAPPGPPPPPVHTGYRLERDVLISPPDWPEALRADIYSPDGTGPFPAVVMIYGGGWHAGTRSQLTPMSVRLAERGYVAIDTTYRLAPRYHFPAQLRDVQLAVRWARAHAQEWHVDPARIGAWGYSAGAHLAALLGGIGPGDALDDPGAHVRAVIAGGTPTDLSKPARGTQVIRLIGGTYAQMPAAYRAASPIDYVTPGDPPVFLYHGSDDTLVPLDHATDYKAALDAAGVPCELMILEGRDHLLAFLTDAPAVEAALHFLDRYLRDAP